MNKKLCLVLIVIVVVAVVNFSSAVDYCNIQSCNGKAHTACTYQVSIYIYIQVLCNYPIITSNKLRVFIQFIIKVE